MNRQQNVLTHCDKCGHELRLIANARRIRWEIWDGHTYACLRRWWYPNMRKPA